MTSASGLEDSSIEAEAVIPEGLYILSSNCIGGNRKMRQEMHYIASISSIHGYPEKFLTTTYNWKYTKSKNASLSGQSVKDSSVLEFRVSRIKIPAIVAFLIEKNCSDLWKHTLRC